MVTKIKIVPGVYESILGNSTYYVARFERSNIPLELRDFWTLATPLYDLVLSTPDIIYVLTTHEDWTVEQYAKLAHILKGLPNIECTEK